MPVKAVAISVIRGKFRETQRVGENGDEAVPTTIVKVIELACDGVDVKHKNESCSIR